MWSTHGEHSCPGDLENFPASLEEKDEEVLEQMALNSANVIIKARIERLVWFNFEATLIALCF